jgi:SAM-dependent methyltransferase
MKTLSTSSVRHFVSRAVYGRRFDAIPWAERMYVRPGDRRMRELVWAWRLRRGRVVSLEDYRAKIPLGEIEEFIGCVVCGQTSQQPLFRPAARNGAWTYRVVRCPGCGFLYRNPNIRPERLGDLYARGYSGFLTGPYAAKRRLRYENTMRAVAPIVDDGAGRRLLDFGCGAGQFLELAEERGFECVGVDLSPDSVEQARARMKRSAVFVGAPDRVPDVASGGFDVITMWSVLAHLPRPIEDLTMLRDLLTPDGVLVILTVNANSLQLKAYGPAWNGFTPNHLMFYSRDTLPRLLGRCGFTGVGFAPFCGDEIEAEATSLDAGAIARIRRRVAASDGGNMMRAVGFATETAMQRWGDGLSELRPCTP